MSTIGQSILSFLDLAKVNCLRDLIICEYKNIKQLKALENIQF